MPRLSSLVHNHGPNEGRGLDCPERLMGACIRGTLEVDGVVYDAEKIRELVREKYKMATELIELRERVRRAGQHLRLRTGALSRLIAQTSKMHVEWKHAVVGGGGSVHRTLEEALEAQQEWEQARSGLWVDVPRPQASDGIRTRLATGWRRP